MTEEHHPETPQSDHQAHRAPSEPHPMKKSVWQRWMAWSGSFLVLSILAHVVLLGGATILVVQVVQSRKEKMKFTAPPPSAAGAAEHKVKPSKKTAAAAPAVSKRITSTAANASIALPAMDMSSSTGPDVMASVMSGLGSAGLGSGAGGGAGMASMPVAGLTAFGFKGGSGGGLKGHFYDLKQTPDRKPTEVKMDGLSDTSGNGNYTPGVQTHLKIMDEFFKGNWDEKILQRFYQAKDTMVTYQVFIPTMPATKAPEAFNVEKEVKPGHWIVHYKGTVTAPKDGSYRFLGIADDTIAVRFDGQNVLLANLQRMDSSSLFTDKTMPTKNDIGLYPGKWFQVERGKPYPIEVLISEVPGGAFQACLLIEERQPEKSYPKRTLQGMEGKLAYPVFQLKKGMPIPPYEKPDMTPPPNALPGWKPREKSPEVAPDPVIFPGK